MLRNFSLLVCHFSPLSIDFIYGVPSSHLCTGSNFPTFLMLHSHTCWYILYIYIWRACSVVYACKLVTISSLSEKAMKSAQQKEAAANIVYMYIPTYVCFFSCLRGKVCAILMINCCCLLRLAKYCNRKLAFYQIHCCSCNASARRKCNLQKQ